MIPFTQFLMPDGRKRGGGFDRSPEIEAIAMKLIDAGARFEIEMLGDGESVHMSCEITRKGEDEVLANAICINGPALPEAVDKLVRDAEKVMAGCSKAT